MEIIIILFFIYLISYATKNQNIEMILRNKGFSNIRRVQSFDGSTNSIYILADKGSVKYLFKSNKYPKSNITEIELANLSKNGKAFTVDKVVYFVGNINVSNVLLKTAASYNVELWNVNGEITNYYQMIYPQTTKKTATKSSRLAKELKKEYEPLEHKKNGVIAKDNCHIEPTTSPIQEHPTTFFKKKTQRL